MQEDFNISIGAILGNLQTDPKTKDYKNVKTCYEYRLG